jgi:UDP-N-acetylmuramyl pentapeptide phosphotransferase/UDP-N-acetylglucosamine-1-phosphate transferase
VIGASVYILLLALFAPLPFYLHLTTMQPSKELGDTGPSIAFPQHSLTTYLASLLTFLIATFLGFLDDLFDIRWRYKLPIPSKSLFVGPVSLMYTKSSQQFRSYWSMSLTMASPTSFFPKSLDSGRLLAWSMLAAF